MDALADILKSINLSASTDLCSEFWGPWGMDISAGSNGVFHAVLEGQCYLNGSVLNESVLLKSGDIVAFPTGGAHWISDQPDSQCFDGNKVLQAVAEGHNPFHKKMDTAISAYCVVHLATILNLNIRF